MKLFSLDWFKSEKQKELEALKVEEQKIKNTILENELIQITSVKIEHPRKKVKLVGDVLTIILQDGNILSKPNATIEDFKKAQQAITESELFKIASSGEGLEEKRKEQEEIEKVKKTIEGFDILKGLDDFEVEGNTVYLKGIKRSLPPLLVEKFVEVVNRVGKTPSSDHGRGLTFWLNEDEEYIGLKRFFMWACLNPRAEVVDKLYDFLTRNKMKITKQGFFVGLRNVADVQGNDKELVDFITNSYHKIKAVWKKKPSDYTIYKNDEGEFAFINSGNVSTSGFQSKNNEVLGNLQELYDDLPNMAQNRFTDGWTKKFDIRIGQKVSMKPEECNWSTQDCATAGLHFAGHTSPYVLYGDTTVFTLHNPMKVVGIGSEKGRCWEYLPFMTTTVSEADEIMNSGDFDFLQLDEQYAIDELEGLTEKIKSGFAVESKKYEINLPSISSSEITKIVKSLEEMKDSISKRVSVID